MPFRGVQAAGYPRAILCLWPADGDGTPLAAHPPRSGGQGRAVSQSAEKVHVPAAQSRWLRMAKFVGTAHSF